MAETAVNQSPSLSEDYLLKEKEERSDVSSKPVEVKEVETPVSPVPEDVVAEKAEETPAAAVTEVTLAATEEVTETTPAATEEVTETTPAATDNSSEDTPAAAEGSTETTEEGNSDEQETTEEKPEIKLETAPADYRFPTTNQTRHCFTRYVEYHRCVAAKGEDAEECNKFAKYYRSLCPDEWIERWNEQRANGTFPGPL